tara:strand:- start:868 stop:1047 length:180 start_codon:yes stop_codon:yes gene_type:complete
MLVVGLAALTLLPMELVALEVVAMVAVAGVHLLLALQIQAEVVVALITTQTAHQAVQAS